MAREESAAQGEDLRRYLERRPAPPQPARPAARVLAVTSGKGGVGKSNLTLNLALALEHLGQRVIVLDADLGLANINILLGFEPPATLADVLIGKTRLPEILVSGPEGMRIIPGASGMTRLAAASTVEIDRIIRGFRELDRECDWLLIDTGAGLSPQVMGFVLAADEVLVVTSPEPTALADAYGMIKAIWESERTLVVRLVVNRARSLDRAERMGRRLIELAAKMLHVEVEWAGLIQEDEHVREAISVQRPFLLTHPKTIAARDVEALARRILSRSEDGGQGVGRFMERFRTALRALMETEPS